MITNIEKKPLYFKFSNFPYHNGEVVKLNNDGSRYKVLNDNCKDTTWKKVLRWFGFKISDRTGHIKLKRI